MHASWLDVVVYTNFSFINAYICLNLHTIVLYIEHLP